MSTPIFSFDCPAVKPEWDYLAKHFARRAYEAWYGALRQRYQTASRHGKDQEAGLSAAFEYFNVERNRVIAEHRNLHVLRALHSAWDSFNTNCEALDLTPILRELHKVN